MLTVAQLLVEVGANVKDAIGGLKSVDGAMDNTARKGGGLKSALGGVGQGLVQGLGQAVTFRALDAVGQGMSFVTDSAIGLNQTLAESKIGFTTMLGSADKAQAHLDELASFAAQTPFEFTAVTSASQKLLAYGFAAKDVVPMLTAVGDASAGLGAGTEGIDRINRALGQMHARGKVTAGEMLQLTEVGIPAWQMLADSMGTTVPKLQDMVTKGLVPADESIQAILDGMNKDFGGLMQKQSQTFGGAMSTIMDTAQMAIAKGTQPLFESVQTAAVGISQFMSSDEGTALFDNMSAGIKTVIDGLISFATSDGVKAFLGSVGEIATAIGEVIASDDFQRFLQAIGSTIQKVLPIIGKVAEVMVNVLGPIIERIAGFLADLLTALGPVFDALGVFVEGLDAATEAANPVLDVLNAVVSFLTGLFVTGLQVAAQVFGDFVAGVAVAGEAIGGVLSNLQAGWELVSTAISNAIGQAVAAVQGFLTTVSTVLGQVVGAITSFVTTAVDLYLRWIGFLLSIPGRIIGLVQGVAGVFGQVLSNIVGFVGQVGANIARGVGIILSLPGKAAGVVAGMAGQVIGPLVNGISGLVSRVGGFIGNIVSTFLSIPGKLAGLVGRMLSLGRQIVGGIINGLASLPGKLIDTIGAAFRNLRIDVGPFHITGSGITIDMPNIQLPSFAVGTPNVPHDMVAAIHQGEAIIPAALAEQMRSLFGGNLSGMGPALAASAVPATMPPVSQGRVANITINANVGRDTGPEGVARSLRRLAALGVLD